MYKLLAVLFMVVVCVIGAFGALYLKNGSAKLARGQNLPNFLRVVFRNGSLWLGLLLYAVSTCLFVALLKHNNLVFIYPLSSLTYVFVVLLSRAVLKEKVTKYKWLAVLLIVAGNIFIAL
jgi:drug/metabolite transporter (DMT)-like permease